MSYILDALRRAERERRRADSTVLETVTQVLAAPPPPAAAVALRRWVPGLLLAAVLLVGVVGGLWLRRPGTPAAPPPSLTALKPTPEVAGNAAAGAPPPAVPSAAAAPAPAPAAPAPPTLTTAESLNEVPPLPPAAVAPQPNEDEATLAAEAAPPDATTPEAVAPAEPVTRPILREHLPSRSSEPAPRAAAARQLQQMPDSYRAHFPALAVDVHVYDDAPSRRFVIIGGHRYGEGETLNAGPRLVQIVPEGMVLDWQGQRVVYALAH